MYRCCTCQAGVSLMEALGASPWLPHTCGACGTEQHRPTNSLVLILGIVFGSLFYLALLIWLLIEVGSGWILAIGAVVPFVLAAVAETVLHRRGVLVPTPPRLKRISRIAWAVIMVPMVTAWVFIELRERSLLP